MSGDLTGNVTASTGSSSFNNVTINGSLDMNAGTTATITNLTSPTNTNDAATKGYVDTSLANLVDSAPGTLDTLNELAAALGDDPNFSTTITNSIATKLPLAGGTMTGAIAMGTSKITGLGDPTAAQDAATKNYVDTQDALQVSKSGDSMSGNLAMGSNNITGLATPTANDHAANKSYVDGVLGSATAASASAAAAATSEANAATSETNAANSATAAASSATSAAASLDSFDDRYLGAKATAPTVDNDGDALIIGALYFDTTTDTMKVYGSSGWVNAGSSVNGTSDRQTYTAYSGQTVFAATYDAGYVDVYLNGVKLLAGTDFTATNGTSITLASGAAVNDIVDIVAYGTFVLADHLTETQSDAKYVQQTHTGNVSVAGTVTVLSGSNGRINIGASNNYLYGDSSNNFIVGTAGSDRLQITSSGNFIVGNTYAPSEYVTTSTNEGLAYQAQDYLVIARNGGSAVHLNRLGSDGNIAEFRKDGTTVGSIGVSPDGASFGNATQHIAMHSNVLFPSSTTHSYLDATIDLGASSGRFKDVWLSGAVYGSDTTGNPVGNHNPGYMLHPTNGAHFQRDGGNPVRIGRDASNGSLTEYFRQGVQVGKVEVFDTDNIGFLSNVSNHGGIICGTASIVPALSGTYSNGATDIGTGTSKWRDIHLSRNLEIAGAVVFDGNSTGLDDYEEGTWTPTITGGFTGSGLGKYTKVGNIVYVAANLYRPTDTSSSTEIQVGGWPFTPASLGHWQLLNVSMRYVNVDEKIVAGMMVDSSSSYHGKILIFSDSGSDYQYLTHSTATSSYWTIQVSGTYMTT